MIYFINGEFQGGDMLDIVHFDFDEFTEEDIWNKPLTEDCYVLEIKRQGDFDLFRAHEYGIYSIPREGEFEETGHGIFYGSEETILFTHFEQALAYIKSYDGSHAEEINKFYKSIKETLKRDTIMAGYCSTIDIESNYNGIFNVELNTLIHSYSHLRPDEVIATLKTYIIDSYTNAYDNKYLNQLN